MKTINVNISDTSIGSYALEGVCHELQIIFSGIPDEWSGNRIYATFVQDNLNPTVEVIDNAVSVPTEILKTGTDFYVSIYSIPYGSNQVSEPSIPILITVNSAESSEMDIGKLVENIVKLLLHIKSENNPHSVTKNQIGLGNVDNTSDMDKPVSDAVRKALDTLIENKLWLSSGNSTAGIMGYYFSDINFDTMEITLTKVQGEAPTEAFNVNYSVGDIVSLNNGSKFPNCSKITAIDKNIITVDSLPFDSMIEDDEPSSDEWNFYVIDKPDAGEIRLGEFAVALGELCLALERSTIAIGRECICYSPYGVSLGRGNISAYAAFSTGLKTEATGFHSSTQNYKTKAPGNAAHAQNRATVASGDDSDAGGFQTEARKKATFTRGYGTIADSIYQAVLGKFNIIDSNNIFAAIIGNGASNTKRSNAFTLDWIGNGWFGGDVTVGPNKEKLATEKHVDEKMEVAGGVGRWSLASRIDGVSAGLKISFLYPVDFTAWHLYLDGKDISGAINPDKAFITAPLIFEDLSKIRIKLESDGVEILSMRMNNVHKNDNVQIGNLLIEEA